MRQLQAETERSFRNSRRGFHAAFLSGGGLIFALALAAWPGALPAQHKGGGASFDIRDLQRRAEALSGSETERPRPAAAVEESGVFVTAAGRPVRFERGRFGAPRTIGSPGEALTAARAGLPREIALELLRARRDVFGFHPDELASLRLVQQTQAGALRIVRLQQILDGLPVYGGRVTVVVDGLGRVVQVSASDAAPGLSMGPDAQLGPEQAAALAFRYVGGRDPGPLVDSGATPDGRLLFAAANAPQAQPAAVDAVVFPLDSGEGRLAWRVIASGPLDSREIVLDAVNGRTLRSVSLTRRFGSARVFDPDPLSQRQVVDFPDGWLAEGATVTTGNNVDAFADLDSDGEPDPGASPGLAEGRATADGSGLFDHPAGDGFLFELEHVPAAITNAFYFANQAHDYFWELGFREADGALQTRDVERGGVEGDPYRIAIENFAPGGPSTTTTPDGISPLMRLPADFSGADLLHTAYEGDAVVHEYAHTVIDRLVGGPDDITCIGGAPQESAIEEGVSDYFSASFLDDPVIGRYFGDPQTGIRMEVMSESQRTYESLGEPSFEEHDDGEIVAAILWEIRTSLGAGTTDQLVLDVLRLLPCFPTFVDLRDALLTVAGPERRATLWPIFARRGLGASARGDDTAANAATLFDAAFDLPDDLASGNRPPRFLGEPGEFALANEDFIYTARAEDPDGDPITFRLLDGPDDAELDPATGRLSYRGKFTSQRVQIEATDGRGGRTVHGLLIFGGSVLTPGRPIQISGDANSIGIGLIPVTGERDALQVTTRGGSGDVDLEVIGPAGPPFLSERIGSDETLTIPNPAFPALWLITVRGFSQYERVVFNANFVSPSETPIGEPLGPLNGAPSSETFYRIVVPEGTPHLRITASGGDGDADLGLSRGRLAVCVFEVFDVAICDEDHFSIRIGNIESIDVPNPAAGEWFLTVRGFEDYTGVTINISTAPSAIELGAATDAAAFEDSIAAGGIGTLFGSGFTDQTLEADALPLPTTLGGVQVFVNGVPAALFFVSPTQINFQLPVETLFIAEVVVANGGELSNHVEAVARPQVPRLFGFTASDGVRSAVVTHADGSAVTPENPARPGEILVGYLTGAALEPQPPSGEPAAADPLSLTVDPAVVIVGGVEATTLFSGATPGFVGLIQVNFQLPEELPAGGRLEIEIRFGDEGTLPLSLPVAP